MRDGSNSKQIDTWQGVVAFVGITLGVLPLLQLLFGSGPGLLKFAIGEDPGVAGWVVPAGVIAISVAVIAWLERVKHAP